MIKIIKDGKIKFKKTCPECGCVFEYEPEDVTKEIVWDDHGGHYPVTHFYRIKCPFCETLITLDDKGLKNYEKEMKIINT